MKKSSVLFFLAVMFLLIVIADLIHWFVVTGDTSGFEAAKQEYLSHYPSAIQNARLLTVISILLLTFSGFIFLNISKSANFKKSASLLGMLSALLLMWKIFSLM